VNSDFVLDPGFCIAAADIGINFVQPGTGVKAHEEGLEAAFHDPGASVLAQIIAEFPDEIVLFPGEPNLIIVNAGTLTAGEHAAAMLANGTVLISGGDVTSNSTFPGDATRTTDIYNPASGARTRGPDMHLPRNGQQVALIPTGTMQNQLLVTGGFGDHSHNTASTAEIYNPSSNSFQCVGPRPNVKLCRDAMVDPRATQATTGFSGGVLGGLILITGGIDMGNQAVLRSAELYNPEANGFVKVGNMVSPRNEHTATELP
jgi:Kelch motif